MRARLPPARHLALVALGGAIGAVGRVAVAVAVPLHPAQLPWATLGANLGGAFLLALLLTVIGDRLSEDPTVRLLVGTGMLGAFTTYSAFSVEVVALVDAGAGVTAAVYLVLTLTGGLTAAGAGVRSGSCLAARRRRTAPAHTDGARREPDDRSAP